jgi:hypothetical protein
MDLEIVFSRVSFASILVILIFLVDGSIKKILFVSVSNILENLHNFPLKL